MTKHAAVFILLFVVAAPAFSEPRVDNNVIYGMHSGLALLMDVHYPEKPNGYGVIFIAGSGWHMPLAYHGGSLKERAAGTRYLQRFLEAGYTVFAINHRAAPR